MVQNEKNRVGFTKAETRFCKGIAIILMLFHHLFNDYEEYAGYVVDYSPFSEDRIMYLALLGKVCVAIFAFLSGYGITVNYHVKCERTGGAKSQGETVRFIFRRYWKLMAAYWFVFALTLLCQPLGRTVFDAYGENVKDILVYFIIDVFGLSYLFGTPSLNPTWWYMSIAIAIVLIIPLVIWLIQKIGAMGTLMLSIMCLGFTGLSNASTVYLFPAVLGAVCFGGNVFGRVDDFGRGRKLTCLIKSLFLLFAGMCLATLRTNYNYFGIMDGLIALDLALLVHVLLVKIPIVNRAMEFLGKESGNMFMIHNQLYSFYFPGFFYSFHYWWLILAALVAVSCLVSVVINFIRRKTGYDNWMNRFICL